MKLHDSFNFNTKLSDQLHTPAALTWDVHWIWGWVDGRAGLDVVAKRESFPCLTWESNLVAGHSLKYPRR